MNGEVSYTQYKNALYKVMNLVQEAEDKRNGVS
jgi:hypothetical protein